MLTVKDGSGFYRGLFFFRPRFIVNEKLQLDLVFLLVEEMKFGEMVIRIGADPHLLLVLPAPVPLAAADTQKTTLGKIGMHDGMHGKDQVLVLVIEQVTKVLLDLILQDQRGRDLARTITGRTNLLGIDRYLGLHPLTRDLH